MKYQSKFLGCFSEKMGISWVHNFSILNPESWGWQRFSIYMARRPIKKGGEEISGTDALRGKPSLTTSKTAKMLPSFLGSRNPFLVAPESIVSHRGKRVLREEIFTDHSSELGEWGMRYDLDCMWGNYKAVHACMVHKNVRGNIVLYWACGQYSHCIRPQRIQTH